MVPFREHGFTPSMTVILLKASCILTLSLNKVLSCLAGFYQFIYQNKKRRKTEGEEERKTKEVGLRIESMEDTRI